MSEIQNPLSFYIGVPVVGGDPGSILYIDDNGLLATSGNLEYNGLNFALAGASHELMRITDDQDLTIMIVDTIDHYVLINDSLQLGIQYVGAQYKSNSGIDWLYLHSDGGQIYFAADATVVQGELGFSSGFGTPPDFTLDGGGSGTLSFTASESLAMDLSQTNKVVWSSGTGLNVWQLSGIGLLTDSQITSTVATGTAPLVVASTTVVTNLNADLLDGINSTAFPQLASNNVFTGTNKINVNSTTALFVEQTGVKSNTLIVDTTNGAVSIQDTLTIAGGTTNANGLALTGKLSMTGITGIVSSINGSGVTLAGGAGFAITSGGTNGGSGGSISATAGNGGANSGSGGDPGVGGSFVLTAGNAGTTSANGIGSKKGGVFTLTAGTGGDRTNTSGTSGGGGFTLQAGSAGISTKNSGSGSYTGDAGGSFVANSGFGGTATNTVGDAVGGAGGDFTFNGRSGAVGRCATGFNATGGAGANMTFAGGAGSSGTRSSVGQVPATSTGGKGGSITFTAGLGGDAVFGTANVNGSGGDVIFDAGAAGTSGSGGLAGNLKFARTTGSIWLGSDNTKSYFGTSQSASIYYDGTDLNINPKEAGSGVLKVLSSLSLSAQNIVTDTTTGMKVATGTTQKVGFWNATPVVQPASTGTTTAGYTANASANAVFAESTFTGNTGSTAYTISDIVKNLKAAGLLAA